MINILKRSSFIIGLLLLFSKPIEAGNNYLGVDFSSNSVLPQSLNNVVFPPEPQDDTDMPTRSFGLIMGRNLSDNITVEASAHIRMGHLPDLQFKLWNIKLHLPKLLKGLSQDIDLLYSLPLSQDRDFDFVAGIGLTHQSYSAELMRSSQIGTKIYVGLNIKFYDQLHIRAGIATGAPIICESSECGQALHRISLSIRLK